MAAILISVKSINFDNTWLAIGEESIYVLNSVKRIVRDWYGS